MRCETCRKKLPEAIDTFDKIVKEMLIMEHRQRVMCDDIVYIKKNFDMILDVVNLMARKLK